MASRPAIERPPAWADRPRPWTVALAGIAGVVLGLLLVRATMGGGRPQGETATAPARPGPQAETARGGGSDADAAAEAEAEAGSDAEARRGARAGEGEGKGKDPLADAGSLADTDAGSVADTGADAGAVAETGSDTDADADTNAGSATGPAAAPPGAPAPTDTIQPLGVAYLRCDGVPKRSGPIPCPRDEPMEARVWAGIDTALARCAGVSGPGEGDVRVYFRPEGPNELRLHERRTDLDGPSLLACLAGPLGEVTSALEPDLMVVSFRFRLGE